MTHVCLFVGADWNGQVRAFPGDEPPLEVVIRTAHFGRDLGARPEDMVATTLFRYVRQVNPSDDGPLWMYVPAPEYADRPEPWDPRHPEQAWSKTITYEDFQRERRGTWAPREPRRDR